MSRVYLFLIFVFLLVFPLTAVCATEGNNIYFEYGNGEDLIAKISVNGIDLRSKALVLPFEISNLKTEEEERLVTWSSYDGYSLVVLTPLDSIEANDTAVQMTVRITNKNQLLHPKKKGATLRIPENQEEVFEKKSFKNQEMSLNTKFNNMYIEFPIGYKIEKEGTTTVIEKSEQMIPMMYNKLEKTYEVNFAYPDPPFNWRIIIDTLVMALIPALGITVIFSGMQNRVIMGVFLFLLVLLSFDWYINIKKSVNFNLVIVSSVLYPIEILVAFFIIRFRERQSSNEEG